MATALLVLAAAGSREREVTRLSTTGMLYDGSGVLPYVSSLILVGAACVVLAGLVVLLALRRRRRDDEFLVVLKPTGTWWQRAIALIAALVLVALLVAAVFAIVHAGQPGHRAASHPAPAVPAAPHLPGSAPPSSGGTVTLALLAVAGGLIVAAIAAAGLLRRGAVASAARETGPVPLAAAVAAASSALGTATSPREAIISCYAAMEESLAAAGSPPLAADTPEELLKRAVDAGAIHTPAAARLTALFREARFSPHLLGEAQRDAAQDALDDITQDLAAAR